MRMVTIAQAQQGIIRFIDAELIPRLSIMEKVLVGGGVGLFSAKLPDALNFCLEKVPFLKVLNVYDAERGELDLEALYTAVKPYIGADPIPIKIPGIGLSLKFTQREIDTLYKYIMEA